MACSESVSILSASEGMSVVASSAESGVSVPAVCQTYASSSKHAWPTQQGLLDRGQLRVCVEHGVDGVQALLLLVAGKVVKVVEEVGDGRVVVVDAVAQGVALGVLVLAALVHGGHDGAGLGDRQGVDVLEVAQLDLVAHLLLLRDGRLRARDEARRLGVVDGRRPRGVGICALAVVHGCGGWMGVRRVRCEVGRGALVERLVALVEGLVAAGAGMESVVRRRVVVGLRRQTMALCRVAAVEDAGTKSRLGVSLGASQRQGGFPRSLARLYNSSLRAANQQPAGRGRLDYCRNYCRGCCGDCCPHYCRISAGLQCQKACLAASQCVVFPPDTRV
jgi:hypothetical protein